jgi:hypothetical protein
MSVLKKIASVIAILVVIAAVLLGINILQKGCGGYQGQTMDQILGVPAAKATPADIEKLSRAKVVQLFHAAQVPAYNELNGEYNTKMVGGGILSAGSDIYVKYLFGPGSWKGKAFSPKLQYGYNIFKSTKDGKEAYSRTKKMKTSIARSRYDAKESFLLDYSPFNSGLLYSMRDEIRKVNATLYVAMGAMLASGDTANPMPFILYGKPAKWVGPDEK